MKKLLFILTFLFIIMACQKENSIDDSENKLVEFSINPSYKMDVTVKSNSKINFELGKDPLYLIAYCHNTETIETFTSKSITGAAYKYQIPEGDYTLFFTNIKPYQIKPYQDNYHGYTLSCFPDPTYSINGFNDIINIDQRNDIFSDIPCIYGVIVKTISETEISSFQVELENRTPLIHFLISKDNLPIITDVFKEISISVSGNLYSSEIINLYDGTKFIYESFNSYRSYPPRISPFMRNSSTISTIQYKGKEYYDLYNIYHFPDYYNFSDDLSSSSSGDDVTINFVNNNSSQGQLLLSKISSIDYNSEIYVLMKFTTEQINKICTFR
ncbi:MAG: hypothetical protein WC140_05445 [Bacteroidales bacterium]